MEKYPPESINNSKKKKKEKQKKSARLAQFPKQSIRPRILVLSLTCQQGDL